MSAIVKAYNVSTLVANTGIECGTALQATAMILVVPPNFSFTTSDLANPLTWLKSKINASKANRVYPMFGQQAPIREIQSKQPNDAIVTLDDGLQVFLRYGFYNREFGTTSGGIKFAKALQTFNAAGYRIIEIDKQGMMLCRNNGDGTYGGLICDFMYSPSPTMADLKSNPYKNHFSISYNPIEVFQNGEIFANCGQFLSLQGLVDSTVSLVSANSTGETSFDLNVSTSLVGTDLLTQIGSSAWAVAGNFIATDLTTNTVLDITGTPTFTAASGSTPAKITIVLSAAPTATHQIQIAVKDVSLLGTAFNGYDFSTPAIFTAS